MSLRIDAPDGKRWRITVRGEKLALFAHLRRNPRASAVPGSAIAVVPTTDTEIVMKDGEPVSFVVEPIDAPGFLRAVRYRVQAGSDAAGRPLYIGARGLDNEVWLVDEWHHALSWWITVLVAVLAGWFAWQLLPSLSSPVLAAFYPFLGAILIALVPGAKKIWEVVNGADRDDHLGGVFRGVGHRLPPTLGMAAAFCALFIGFWLSKDRWSPAAVNNATGATIQYTANIAIASAGIHVDHEWTYTRALRDRGHEDEVITLLRQIPRVERLCVLSPELGLMPRGVTMSPGAAKPEPCHQASPQPYLPDPQWYAFLSPLNPFGVTLGCRERYLRSDLRPEPDDPDFYACTDPKGQARHCPMMAAGCESRNPGPWHLHPEADARATYVTEPAFALATDKDPIQVEVARAGTMLDEAQRTLRLSSAEAVPKYAVTVPYPGTEAGGSLVLPFPAVEVTRFDLSYLWGPQAADRTQIGEGFHRVLAEQTPLILLPVKFSVTEDLAFSLRRGSEAIWNQSARTSDTSDDSILFSAPSPASSRNVYSLTFPAEFPRGGEFSLVLPAALLADSVTVTLADGRTASCAFFGASAHEVRVASIRLPIEALYAFSIEENSPDTRVSTFYDDHVATVIQCRSGEVKASDSPLRIVVARPGQIPHTRGRFVLDIPAGLVHGAEGIPLHRSGSGEPWRSLSCEGREGSAYCTVDISQQSLGTVIPCRVVNLVTCQRTNEPATDKDDVSYMSPGGSDCAGCTVFYETKRR